VPVGHGSEYFRGELFGKEQGALGLATGAEIPGAASKRQKVLIAAFWATNPSKASFQPAAAKKRLHRAHYHRAQGSRAGLEAFLVGPDITVKVSLEQLVKTSALGVPWPVCGRRFLNDPSAGVFARTETGRGRIGPGDDQLVAERHVRQ
jgi:hypothetical protein